MSTAIDVEISDLIESELLRLEKPRYWLSATGLARKLKLKQNNNSNWNCLSEKDSTSKIYMDFPDFARHQMSYIVTSTRGVYEQRQTVYPRV
jgi:hypothetical protein